MDKKNFKLSKEHQEVARQIIERNVLPKYSRRYKDCERCSNTRTEGVTEQGLIKPCTRCINTIPCMQQWYEYCKAFPDLAEFFLGEKLTEICPKCNGKYDGEKCYNCGYCKSCAD